MWPLRIEHIGNFGFRPFGVRAAHGLPSSWVRLIVPALLCLGANLQGQPDLPISAAERPSGQASPAQSYPATNQTAPAAPHAEVSAGQVLGSLLSYLSSQTEYYAEVTCTASLSLAGMERVNSARSRVWMRRPDHFVWTTLGDLGSSAMAVDGQLCTLYLPSLQRYTQKPLDGPGAAAAQLAAMTAPYGAVAGLLLSADMTSITLETLAFDTPVRLEPEVVYGIPCEHVQLPAPSGVTDLWIAQGPAPVPVRLTSSVRLPPAAATKDMGPASSQYEVDFRWKVNVRLPDSTFALNLPGTAQKVDILGGPNLTAMSWKPASSDRSGKMTKPPSKRPAKPVISDLKQRGAEAGLAYAPPPSVGTGGASPAMLDGNAPSLSGGLSDVPPVAAPPGKTSSPAAASGALPDLSLPLLQGGSVKLSSLRGRAVVLDFWATWCGPCREAMPVVEQLAGEWRGRGVEFYAVNMDEAPATVKNFASKQGMRLPVVMDSGGALARSFGVSGIPYLVVIGRDGTLKASHTGAGSSLRNELSSALSAAVR